MAILISAALAEENARSFAQAKEDWFLIERPALLADGTIESRQIIAAFDGIYDGTLDAEDDN